MISHPPSTSRKGLEVGGGSHLCAVMAMCSVRSKVSVSAKIAAEPREEGHILPDVSGQAEVKYTARILPPPHTHTNPHTL